MPRCVYSMYIVELLEGVRYNGEQLRTPSAFRQGRAPTEADVNELTLFLVRSYSYSSSYPHLPRYIYEYHAGSTAVGSYYM